MYSHSCNSSSSVLIPNRQGQSRKWSFGVIFIITVMEITLGCSLGEQPRRAARISSKPKFEVTHVKSTSIIASDVSRGCGIKSDGDAKFDDTFTKLDSRVEYAKEHEWPWMASIVNISDATPVEYCGATVISNRHVLTAAHCLPDMRDTGVEHFVVHLGASNVQRPIQTRTIINLTAHPNFDFDSADFDAAILTLGQPLAYDRYVKPVCLDRSTSTYRKFVGKVGLVTGWGSFNLTSPTDDHLKEAKVRVVSSESCAKNYTPVDIPITNQMICATTQPGEEPCKGDSGGPLLMLISPGDDASSTSEDHQEEYYLQIGIVSHGQGCADRGYPTIFSRVAAFSDWIYEVIQSEIS